MLAKPKERPDESIHCRLDFAISKMALKAIPSKRMILLALPKIRLVDFGRIYYQVSPAALKYQPTQRIIELSMPRVFIKEETDIDKLQIYEKRVLDEERLSKLALAKKLLDHSEQLTKEELEKLFTPYGVKRTALLYQVSLPQVCYSILYYSVILHIIYIIYYVYILKVETIQDKFFKK